MGHPVVDNILHVNYTKCDTTDAQTLAQNSPLYPSRVHRYVSGIGPIELDGTKFHFQ